MLHEELLEAILDVARAKYAGDISVMLVYGSTVAGNSTEKSDLDILYVPKTQRGKELARTFMIGDVGNDLWWVPWERLERFASYEDMMVSIIAESRLVFYANQEDLARYESLKKKAKQIEKGGLTPDLIQKAKTHLAKAKEYFAELCLGGGLSSAGGALYEIIDTVCLLNHTYLHHGMKTCVEEISRFEHLPQGFTEAFRAVAAAPSKEAARSALCELINRLGRFLREREEEVVPPDALANFAGLYEEISSHWNKIRAACGKNDGMTALLAASSLQAELDFVCERSRIACDELNMMRKYDPNDLGSFLNAAQAAENAFVSLLKSEGVPIAKFQTIKEFKGSLMG